MKCPFCSCPDSKVIDSRPNDDKSIRRRRECLGCQKRFTTYEIIESQPLIVIKKDGAREIFDQNKIMTGLVKACYKRPVSVEQMKELIAEIEAELQNSLKNEIPTTEIGSLVMEKLKKLDEISYVRFASVYREFKDVETFMAEISDLQKEKKNNK